MEYRYPEWPRIVLPTGDEPNRALQDWAQGTALGGRASYQVPEGWESGECSCLERSLAELEDLLKSLDAYDIEQ